MTPATGNPRKFHKGRPPFPSWWLTSNRCIGPAWRWWDGLRWSFSLFEDEEPQFISLFATAPTGLNNKEIRWSDYWPANARVPRINPNKETA